MISNINGVQMAQVDVYTVGVLSDMRLAYRATRRGKYELAVSFLEHSRKSVRRNIKARNWRALGNEFNGYLAEVNYPPEGLRHSRCGHGWTRRRAVRRLGQYLAADNPGRIGS